MTDTAATVKIDDSADALRRALIERLLADGAITSGPVEAAFATVPRHLFAPEASLRDAYANDVIRTKIDANGVTTSSVSAPWLQALMLEQAGIEPGMRCLEIGSGGYNAALMAELVGPSGSVTTVDIDPDVTDRARRYLTATRYDRVRVVLGDAEQGVPERAPYDRIIVTAGAWDVPPAWFEQLTDQGRVVMPLRMRGLSRSVALDRHGDHLSSVSHHVAGFVKFQGAGARDERLVVLHGDEVGLRFDENEGGVNPEAMQVALHCPRVPAWSGVTFGASEPFDGLFLWLATAISDYCTISRARTDIARALADPASPIATPATYTGDSFAYVTFRETAPGRYEFGAYGHGPGGGAAATALVEQIQIWDREHRHSAPATISVYLAHTAADHLPAGRVIRKRHTVVVVGWPAPAAC